MPFHITSGCRMPTALERFHAKYEIRPGPLPTPCWVWTAAKSRRGYARLQIRVGFCADAYRWGYEQLVGPIPQGAHMDHLCRNTSCVNPAHLEPVSCRTNILRGEGFAAKNAVKTHCPKGHEYTAANTYLYARGRTCKRCVIERTDRVRAEARQRRRTAEARRIRINLLGRQRLP